MLGGNRSRFIRMIIAEISNIMKTGNGSCRGASFPGSIHCVGRSNPSNCGHKAHCAGHVQQYLPEDLTVCDFHFGCDYILLAASRRSFWYLQRPPLAACCLTSCSGPAVGTTLPAATDEPVVLTHC